MYILHLALKKRALKIYRRNFTNFFFVENKNFTPYLSRRIVWYRGQTEWSREKQQKWNFDRQILKLLADDDAANTSSAHASHSRRLLACWLASEAGRFNVKTSPSSSDRLAQISYRTWVERVSWVASACSSCSIRHLSRNAVHTVDNYCQILCERLVIVFALTSSSSSSLSSLTAPQIRFMILALYKFVCMYIYLSQYLYACMYVCMTGQQGMNALKAAQQSAMKSNTNSFISSGKSITRPRYNGNGGDDDENYFKKPNRLQFFFFLL